MKLEDELRLKSDAIETMMSGFDIVDENGKFVYANPAYLKMWGYSSLEEIVGTSPDHHCVDPEVPLRIMQVLQKEGYGDFDFLARRKDGSTFEVHMAARLFQDSDGKRYFTGVSTDMTERNQLLRQYRQSQKMEAIGRLVGGVVHDFNNILQVIFSSAQLIMEQTDNSAKTCEETERILTAAERAASLTRQLLLTSRRQPLQEEYLDLPQAISDVVKMTERLLGDHITIDWRPPGSFPQVLLDRALFEQILVNLVINARDAMSETGGMITITLENSVISGSEFACLTFQDQGCGIEPGNLESIFEPFFTTKAEGKGSGLGLSTVYGIVESHGGKIRVKSRPGHGTTFVIELPLASGTSPTKRESQEPLELRSLAGKTVLVAEDNEQVRQTIRLILKKAKCRTLFAKNGKEAVELFEKHGREIDLAILDMLMPEMNGTEALAEMRKQNPHLPAFFSSGYNDSRLERESELVRNTPILPKPYTANDLFSMMRKVI
ncbi:MAG TPA: response regulator [Phycisphaerales bacterium]|nr:response regulator [Phycisphaerales bacterium]